MVAVAMVAVPADVCKPRTRSGTTIVMVAPGVSPTGAMQMLMLAFAMMATIRIHANAMAPPPKTIRKAKKPHPQRLKLTASKPTRR